MIIFFFAAQQINLRFAHKKSDKKLDGFSIIPTLSVFQAIMVKNLVIHSDQCRISGSHLILQPKKVRNCEYRNAVLNIEIRFSTFGLYPSTKENNYAPVICILRPHGAGDTGDIAGLKCRNLISDVSRQCRGCARVLISR